MSDPEFTIIPEKIDVGSDYWNNKIRDMQKDHDPLILWITKEIMKELKE